MSTDEPKRMKWPPTGNRVFEAQCEHVRLHALPPVMAITFSHIPSDYANKIPRVPGPDRMDVCAMCVGKLAAFMRMEIGWPEGGRLPSPFQPQEQKDE
jgi:hypothetical protein